MMFWRTLCDVCLDTNLRKAKLERLIAYEDAAIAGLEAEAKLDGKWSICNTPAYGRALSKKKIYQYELEKLEDDE